MVEFFQEIHSLLLIISRPKTLESPDLNSQKVYYTFRALVLDDLDLIVQF